MAKGIKDDEIIRIVLRINREIFQLKKEVIEMFSAYMQEVNLKKI